MQHWIKDVIAKRISQLLEEENMTQKELTYMLYPDDTPKEHLSHKVNTSRWLNENDKTEPPLWALEVIKEHFNVSLDYLYGFSDFRNPSNDYIGNETGLSDKAIDFLSKAHKSKDDFSNKTVNFINYVLENDTSSDDTMYWSIFATMWEYITAYNNKFYFQKAGNEYETRNKAYFRESGSDKMIEKDLIPLYAQERLYKVINTLQNYYEKNKISNEIQPFNSGADFMEKWNELTKEAKKKGRAKNEG